MIKKQFSLESILTGLTGVCFGNSSDFSELASHLAGRGVQTVEFLDREFIKELENSLLVQTGITVDQCRDIHIKWAKKKNGTSKEELPIAANEFVQELKKEYKSEYEIQEEALLSGKDELENSIQQTMKIGPDAILIIQGDEENVDCEDVDNELKEV